MRDLLYLRDDQIKDFIEQIFYAYRETYSDPKKILKKIKKKDHVEIIFLQHLGKIQM